MTPLIEIIIGYEMLLQKKSRQLKTKVFRFFLSSPLDSIYIIYFIIMNILHLILEKLK